MGFIMDRYEGADRYSGIRTRVTGAQFVRLIEGETVEVDGHPITMDDGPFEIVPEADVEGTVHPLGILGFNWEERGGPGSGDFGHAGRPGEVGGSAPGGGNEGSQKIVGITSAKGDKPSASVFEEMRRFEGDLRNIEGVTNVTVKPGLGGYTNQETGEVMHEATWVVGYKGDGDAMDLLVATAAAYEQESVLVMEPATKGDSQPVSELEFWTPLTPDLRTAIEDTMEGLQVPGWTWGRSASGVFLRIAAVKEWGFGEGGHRAALAGLEEELANAGLITTRRDFRANMTVLTP